MANLKVRSHKEESYFRTIRPYIKNDVAYHILYNEDAEKSQLQPINYDVYMPNVKEERLWSRQIKVPKRPFARLCYRVREDYYKVTELYTDPEIKIPDMRLIGTDVIIHHTDLDGKFAYVVELETRIVHKIYFKFLRLLQPGEILLLNRWVFYSCKFTFVERKPVKNYSDRAVRFHIEMRGSQCVLTMQRSSLRHFEGCWNTQFFYTNQDLRETLIEALVWVIEDLGYLNAFERELYNDIIYDRMWENPYVQNILNNSVLYMPQDF